VGWQIPGNASKRGLKKEKQPWQSQRCFPGCVLEVVCIVRRRENGKVAQVRKILGERQFLFDLRHDPENTVEIQTLVK
jgi:hypothetical protein